ncbi:MAG TPA: dTDP-4-dehydrorhamnose reductase [Polyangiaceae bacterium]|nr:dTDP-4-dehydrorhamnose reductase [Polyangiaceae bacterium]
MSSAKVWLAGARGMLGRVIAAKLAERSVPFVATDVDLDIANAEAVEAFANAERPSVIVNAAAYTRVDDAESQAADAFRVNAEGAATLARAARGLGAACLYFSTDYVFDGQARAPYVETAPCAPSSVYGRSKREGEVGVLRALEGGSPYVLRTSWLFGENGPSFVRTMLTLMREREELRVVRDQEGRPTYTHDLADVALRLVGVGGAAAPAGIYHFANAGPTTWYDFAHGIHDAALRRGVPLRVARIVPVSTAEFPRPAPRPAYSVLDTGRIEKALGITPRHWMEALDEHLEREMRGQE